MTENTTRWIVEPIRHFLETTFITDEGLKISNSEEFTPSSPYLANTEIYIMPNTREVRVRPFIIEHLKLLVEEKYATRPSNEVFASIIINELLVGIRDQTNIAYVGKVWTPKDFYPDFSPNDEKVTWQYFFKKDRPSSATNGRISGPWPLSDQPILDERLARPLLTLRGIRPNVCSSLERCVEYLCMPNT